MTPTASATRNNPQSAQPPLGRGGSLALLIVICTAVFLTALDQTVVVTAILPIANTFSLPTPGSLAQISWIVSGYLLGYVIVMPLMGRVSDLWGRQRTLLGCLGLFAFGSLLCAESPALSSLWSIDFFHTAVGNSVGLTWLIIARFLQAVGGGAVVPVAIAAIGDLYGEHHRALALGVIGGVTEAGGALGPLYGAIILQHWPILVNHQSANGTADLLTLNQTWQWIFLLNVPIVLVIAGGLLLVGRRGSQAARAAPAIRGKIDWLGAAILGGALLCVSLGLGQQAGTIGTLKDAQASQNNPLLLLAAVVLLGIFIAVEAYRADPIIPLNLFRRGAFSASALFSFLLGMALIIALVDIPLYILTVIDPSAYLDAGLALLRMTVMIPIGAFAGGWLVGRIGCRPIGALGAALTAIGFLVMHSWSVQINWTVLTIGTIITGLGFGLIVAPISTTALNTTSIQRFGTASAVVTALRMVGMILGLAVLSSWGVGEYNRLNAHIAIPTTIASDPVKVLQYLANQQTVIAVRIVTDFYLFGAGIAALAILPAIFLWRHQQGAKRADDQVSVFSMGL